jgi:hypothetical protein
MNDTNYRQGRLALHDLNELKYWYNKNDKAQSINNRWNASKERKVVLAWVFAWFCLVDGMK